MQTRMSFFFVSANKNIHRRDHQAAVASRDKRKERCTPDGIPSVSNEKMLSGDGPPNNERYLFF